MKRSEMREQGFFLTFENLFTSNNDMDELIDLYSDNVEEVCDYAKEILQGVSEHKDEFNALISRYLKSWKLSRLPKVSLAILYVALFEMKYAESVPDNVAINEAVELAKKYSTKDDASFINGVLGAISRGE